MIKFKIRKGSQPSKIKSNPKMISSQKLTENTVIKQNRKYSKIVKMD